MSHDTDPSKAAQWALARRLHYRMEQMHPEGETWDELPDDQRDWYYCYVSAILQEPKLIRQFYGWAEDPQQPT